MQLISLVPTDPTVLQRLGDMYEDSDKSQSFQYYLEVLVTTVIIWLYTNVVVIANNHVLCEKSNAIVVFSIHDSE